MKKSFAITASSLLFLAACGSATTGSATLDDKLKNPLYAQHYYQELTSNMVTLQLSNDPILKESGKQSLVDRTRIEGTKQAQEAVDTNASGPHGTFISDKDLVQGSVLMLGDTLYFGPDLVATPGPSLHVYISNTVDPRVGTFPDSSAVDLGVLQDPFGAQSYALPKNDQDQAAGAPPLRTVVLWDKELEMVYGFVQLAE